MAPIQLTPMEVVLTFSSPSSLSSHSALEAISTAAKSAPSSLLVVLKFDFPFLPTASASYSSSSSSSTAPPPLPWTALQRLLARCYAAATSVFIAQDRPLTPVDVVLSAVRELAICPPDGAKVERVRIDDAGKAPLARADDDKGDEGRKSEYDVVALGGTFDHLHAGHKALLTMGAVLARERLIVGVTDPVLLKKKRHHAVLQSLSERIDAVRSFLELIKPAISHDVVPITDVYGPTAHDNSVEALVVSSETRSGGDAVNTERKKNGLAPLDIFVIELLAADGGNAGDHVEAKMGSTAIRAWIEKNANPVG